MKLITKHDIRDKVFIDELERTGYVCSILINEKGIQYQVCYFNDGQHYTVWLYDFEIKAI